MINNINWFQTVLDTAIQLYFKQECKVDSIYKIQPPQNGELEAMAGIKEISFDERVVLMLALMPHLYPQALDILFSPNTQTDRHYTEFGGWKGISHAGFLPTGETAAFILTSSKIENRKNIVKLFDNNHWFYTHNILHLNSPSSGEPFLSGQLQISEEFLSKVIHDQEYKPDYNTEFPAKRITTPLNWDDLVLDYQVSADIEEVNTWITENKVIMESWGLNRFLKAGYRTLFYGPPGTGKTLTASLIGKKNQMDVYRVDLSMIVSKYIGETEKNLAKVFDMAEHRDWILFFDEADALFGKRTSNNSSNDRHANQEIAYLLQRIEDFPGTVILATNLQSNIDEAFSRRFQSIIYFPMPSKEQRAELWQKMLPVNWLDNNPNELISIASESKLSGGSICNVIRRCALQMLLRDNKKLSKAILKEALQKELLKV